MHGHNYAVTVDVSGELTPDSWVIDFGDVKALARGVCKELDHRFILQASSRLLDVNRSHGRYEISFRGRRYGFPEGDVVALPIDNSTAERLAEYLAGRIAAALRERGASNVTSITVGVEEAPGQTGWYTLPLR